jgi:hypothetical protein
MESGKALLLATATVLAAAGCNPVVPSCSVLSATEDCQKAIDEKCGKGYIHDPNIKEGLSFWGNTSLETMDCVRDSFLDRDCSKIRSATQQAIDLVLKDGVFFECNDNGRVITLNPEEFMQIDNFMVNPNDGDCRDVIKESQDRIQRVVGRRACKKLPGDKTSGKETWKLYEQGGLRGRISYH